MKIILLILVLLGMIGCSGQKVTGVDRGKASFKVLWAKNLDPKYETGNLPVSLNSPAVHDGIIYLGSLKGDITAYSIDNGKEIWSFNEKRPLFGRPALFKDQVIYGGNDGRLFSRHYMTGKLKYAVDLGAAIESDPIFYRGRILLHLRNHKLISLDALTGKILWAYRRSVPFTTTVQGVSRPTAINDRVYVGFADGYVVAFSLEDGLLLWERKISTGSKFIDVDISPTIVGNNLYVASRVGTLVIIDPKTGAVKRKLKYDVSRAPLVTKGGTYIGTKDGFIAQIELTGDLLRKTQISKKLISNILTLKNYLIVTSTDRMLYIVDKKDFSVIDRFDLGSFASSVYGRAVVEEDKLVLFSSRNRLYVFSI